MTQPHFSVALPARDVERAGIAARIGPWMGVSAASWPALLSGLVAPLADRAAIRSLVAGGFPSRDAYVLVDRDAWSSGKREAQRRGRILEVLRSSARPILADDGRFVLWGPQPGGGVP